MHQIHSKKDIIVHQADDIVGLQQEVARLEDKLAASKAKRRKWRRRARYLKSECDNVLDQRDEALAEIEQLHAELARCQRPADANHTEVSGEA